MISNLQIVRSKRRTISIEVTPLGEVVVKAPRLVPEFVVKQFVESKREWIEKTVKKIQERRPVKKQYQEGEEFLYLGKPYRLQIGEYKEISVTDAFNFPKFLTFRREKEIKEWYMQQAKEIITQRLNFHAKQMDAEYSRVFFSDTISKWGTCFPDNSLQFNWRLVMTPLLVLDYVVIHELTHTTEKNHGRRFWKKVESFTPAHKQWRKWLRTNSHLLHF